MYIIVKEKKYDRKEKVLKIERERYCVPKNWVW